MKVNYDKKEAGVYLSNLIVGTAFSTKRSSSSDEIGLYMIVDKNSGVFLDSYKNKIMAVNLASGQIRAFNGNQKVEPIDAEVNLSK